MNMDMKQQEELETEERAVRRGKEQIIRNLQTPFTTHK